MRAKLFRILASTAALLLSAAVVSAQEPAKTAPKQPVKKQTAAPVAKPAAGMVVAKDPVTGQLRAPTAEEMQQLTGGGGTGTTNTRQSAKSSDRTAVTSPAPVTHPDGSLN